MRSVYRDFNLFPVTALDGIYFLGNVKESFYTLVIFDQRGVTSIFITTMTTNTFIDY